MTTFAVNYRRSILEQDPEWVLEAKCTMVAQSAARNHLDRMLKSTNKLQRLHIQLPFHIFRRMNKFVMNILHSIRIPNTLAKES